MANNSVINRSGLAPLLTPIVTEWYDSAYNDTETYPEIYSRVYNVTQSKKAVDYVGNLVGMGLFSEKTEGGEYESDTISIGRMTSFVNKTFGKVIRITKEMVEDDQTEEIQDLASGFGRAARLTVEYSAMLPFALGFGASTAGQPYGSTTFGATGTTFLLQDGKPLFASDHPYLKATTTSAGYALPTTGDNLVVAAFSETSLASAVTKLRKQANDRGVIDTLRTPKTIMVPIDMEILAHQIVKSTSTTESTQAAPYNSGVKNKLAPFSIEVLANPYLPDAADCFLLAQVTKQTLGNRFQWRVKPGKVESEDDFNRDVAAYKQRMRYACGFRDWRGVVGLSPS